MSFPYTFSQFSSVTQIGKRETEKHPRKEMWGDAESGINGAHPLVFTLFHKAGKFNSLGFQLSMAEWVSTQVGSSVFWSPPHSPQVHGEPLQKLLHAVSSASVQAPPPARLEENRPSSNLNPGSEVFLAVPRLPIGMWMPLSSKEAERQSGDYKVGKLGAVLQSMV